MILGAGPRIICLDFIDIYYHGCLHVDAGELCNTKLRDGTAQCYRYLAGFVLYQAKPLIVAVTPVRSDEPKSNAIERLDAVAPVALPIIRRGKQMAEKLDTIVSY